MIEGFSIGKVAGDIRMRRVSAQKMVEQLRIAELHAIALARIFKEKNYLTPDQIILALPPGPFHVELVAAYLAGYLAGETRSSLFDVATFGINYSSMDGGDRVVGAAFSALLNLVENKGIRIQGPGKEPPVEPLTSIGPPSEKV